MINSLKEIKGIILVVLVIVLMIIVSGVSVYATATYLASEVNYTTDKNTNIKNVGEALNDLYSKINESNVETYSSGSISKTGEGTFWSKQLNISQNVRKVTLYLNVASSYGTKTPTIIGEIIESNEITTLGSGGHSGLYATSFYKIEIITKQKDGTITINANVGGNQYSYNHIASMVVVYE